MATDSDVVLYATAAAAVAPAGLAEVVPGGAAGPDVIESMGVMIASVVIVGWSVGMWSLRAMAAAV